MGMYRDDRSKCIECYCNEPCYGHVCPLPGTKCAVEAVRSRPGQSRGGTPQYRAVCRDETKQGVCPKVPRDNKYASCTEDCTSDSDCDGDQKCCFNGCGNSCMAIVKDPGYDLLGGDDEELVPAINPNAPQIRVKED